MNRKMLSAAAGFMAFALSGCATTAFQAPIWPCSFDATTGKCTGSAAMDAQKANLVDGYLRANVFKYDQLVADAEAGKVITEVPIILAAVGGATSVALGASTKVAIGSAGVGALGSGFSSWVKPRERIGYIVQSRAAATCILREHTQLTVAAASAGIASYDTTADRKYAAAGLAATYANASVQVANAGTIALAASDEVVSRLKVRLAGVGSAPDFSGIIEEMRRMKEQAAAGLVADKAALRALAGVMSPPSDAEIAYISEYSVRIDTCVAKMQ